MISFEIKELPKMPNAVLRQHYFIIKKEADKWHALVLKEVAKQRPNRPYPKAKLTLTRYSTNEPDYDGLVGSFKWVVDALVKSGIIIDDKYSVIGKSDYIWEKVSKRVDQRIQVTIEMQPI